MTESTFQDAFNSASGAVAMALVEVLRTDGVISNEQAKRVFLAARRHLQGLPNTAWPDDILTRLAKEIPGNG